VAGAIVIQAEMGEAAAGIVLWERLCDVKTMFAT
jgi:hypothetical protein